MRILPPLLLSLAACRAPAPPPPPPPFVPPPRATQFLVKEVRLAGGVVGVHVEIPLEPSGPKPAVIALIGDTRQFVGAGFVVVTYSIEWGMLKDRPKPPPAEQAVGKWVLAAPTAATLGEQYLRDIVTTATVYVPGILDWLETVPEVDAKRIGMVGGSTNGFVTLAATAAERRIGVAAAITACGDYLDFLRYSSMGMEGKPLELDRRYERWIRSQEVIRHPERLVHAAVYMMNRADDELIPVSCADATARILTRAYARAGHPSRFRYLRLTGGGHGFGRRRTTPRSAGSSSGCSRHEAVGQVDPRGADRDHVRGLRASAGRDRDRRRHAARRPGGGDARRSVSDPVSRLARRHG